MGDPDRRAPFALRPGVAFCSLRFQADETVSHALSLEDARHGSVAVALPERLQTAVAKRRAEFLAGRMCAALVLADLGLAGADVPVNPDRSPRWPEGMVGSVAHGAGLAMAVAGRAGALRGLGLDCETVMSDARAGALGGTILSPGDAALRPDGMGEGAFVTLVFSAKEALYKAVYPRLLHIFGFHSVQLAEIGAGRVVMELGDVPGADKLSTRRFVADYVMSKEGVVCLVSDQV